MLKTYVGNLDLLPSTGPEKLPPEASAAHTVQQEVNGVISVEQEV